MQIQDWTGSGASACVDANHSLQTTPRHPTIGSNGAYRLGAYTGALTVVAAGTATAGHLFAARWSHATKLALVTFFRARWSTIAGFTAAQEVGMDLVVARSYTAAHTGGTAITLTANALKKSSLHGTTTLADARIGATGALTAGTHTLDAQPMASGFYSELAAGAAVPKGFFELVYQAPDLATHPLVLTQDTGLVLRNVILMGAGGTARVAVEMEWLEVDSFS